MAQSSDESAFGSEDTGLKRDRPVFDVEPIPLHYTRAVGMYNWIPAS